MATLSRRCLFEGGIYFDMGVKQCGAYLRPGAYQRKYRIPQLTFQSNHGQMRKGENKAKQSTREEE